MACLRSSNAWYLTGLMPSTVRGAPHRLPEDGTAPKYVWGAVVHYVKMMTSLVSAVEQWAPCMRGVSAVGEVIRVTRFMLRLFVDSIFGNSVFVDYCVFAPALPVKLNAGNVAPV